jgi:hypothetical protein
MFSIFDFPKSFFKAVRHKSVAVDREEGICFSALLNGASILHSQTALL